MRISTFIALAALLGMTRALCAADPASESFKVGVAVKVITPSQPIWLAGYPRRNRPAEGKVHDLYVKALALEDPDGGKLVLMTSDLIALPRKLADAVADAVTKRTGLRREQLMLTCSHTHCAPVMDNDADYYSTTPEDRARIVAYTRQMQDWMTDAIVASLEDLKPARLSVGMGTAGFAVNRRQVTDKGIINGYNPTGPTDRDVPVLRVETPDGQLRAVVFGYACHNTTLQFYQYCGDYAGFAQTYVQEKHPGAVAMFWAGCGGDANPLPRSTIALCQRYGAELSAAVETVLQKNMTPVRGACAAQYALVSIPFDKLPTREELTPDLKGQDMPLRKRAERLIHTLDTAGKLPDHYSYPVQVWRLGDEVLWISLAGEAVVDYSHRFKKEYAGKRAVWVTAYANDVMSYIPSLRVLREGGYEGDTSMMYTGLPAKWGPAIEDLIAGTVHDLAEKAGK
jgi:neutral ceramidase